MSNLLLIVYFGLLSRSVLCNYIVLEHIKNANHDTDLSKGKEIAFTELGDELNEDNAYQLKEALKEYSRKIEDLLNNFRSDLQPVLTVFKSVVVGQEQKGVYPEDIRHIGELLSKFDQGVEALKNGETEEDDEDFEDEYLAITKGNKKCPITIFEDRQIPETVEVLATGNLNIFIDAVMFEANKQLTESREGIIPIPDLEKSFIKNLGPFKVKGNFTATDGWFKDMGTMVRTGDASLTRNGPDGLSLQVSLGLQRMELGYKKYKVKFLNIGPTGRMDIEVYENSITLQASFRLNDKECQVNLDKVVLDRFSGMKAKLTGLGKLGNWLLNGATNWALEHFRDSIKQKVENKVEQKIRNTLEKKDICKFLKESPIAAVQSYMKALKPATI